MTNKENYRKFVNLVCEMLGFNKPIDVLKLCQITSEFIRPYEKRIAELEKENEQKFDDSNRAWKELVKGWVVDYRSLEEENEQLKQQIEKMKSHTLQA